MKVNSIILIGNTGGNRIHEGDGKPFATFSVATTDTYKDDGGMAIQGNRGTRSSPSARLWCKASNRSRPGHAFASRASFPTAPSRQLPDGQTVTKREASVIARKVEQAPLVKKADKAEADAA